MKTYIVEDNISNNSNLVYATIKNFDNIASFIPYQVGRGHNEITLRFTRFLVFNFKIILRLENIISNKSSITYTLKSDRGDSLEFFFTIKEDKMNRSLINIVIKYNGEKEWIVGKYLEDIGKSILRGIRELSIKTESLSTIGNFSESLSKISFISKLLMKSRLVKSDEINVSKGQLINNLLELIQEYLKYKLIYVSGTSQNTSFRIVFIDGDVKGTYVNINGKESFNEKTLNELEGLFKINIYVSLTPLEILKGVIDESS